MTLAGRLGLPILQLLLPHSQQSQELPPQQLHSPQQQHQLPFCCISLFIFRCLGTHLLFLGRSSSFHLETFFSVSAAALRCSFSAALALAATASISTFESIFAAGGAVADFSLRLISPGASCVTCLYFSTNFVQNALSFVLPNQKDCTTNYVAVSWMSHTRLLE